MIEVLKLIGLIVVAVLGIGLQVYDIRMRRKLMRLIERQTLRQARLENRVDATVKVAGLQQQLLKYENDRIERILKSLDSARN